MNLYNKSAIFLGLLTLFLLGGCFTSRVVPTLDITVMPAKFDQRSPAKRHLEVLTAIVSKNRIWEDAGKELKLILKAQDAMDMGDLRLAGERWLEACLSMKGDLATYSLDQWASVMSKILGKVEPGTLGRLFWGEVKGSSTKSWILTNAEISDEASSIEYFDSENLKSGLSDEEILDSEKKDALLTKRARLFCKEPSEARWKSFLKELSIIEKKYWDALVKACMNERESALGEFLKISTELWTNIKTRHYAISAYQKIVNIHRYLGDRESAAKGFIILAEKIKHPSLTYEIMGYEDEVSWRLEQINTVLWAARYSAMIGNYKIAKDFVEDSIKQLDIDWLQLGASEEQLESKSELFAEAYHVLANRIFLEKGDFSSAYRTNRLGLSVEGLSEEWQQRFLWFEGWYLYLDKKPKLALPVWKALLDTLENQEDKKSSEEKVLFWLAKVSQEIDQSSDFSDYRETLSKKYPLGFYNLYSLEELNWKSKVRPFSGAHNLRKDLSKWDVDIKQIFKNEDLNQLRLRAELAILIGSEKLAQLTAKELYRNVRRKIKISRTETHLYVSRLLYINSLFPQAIGLTSLIYLDDPNIWNEYPEQVLVYFPTPYNLDFKKNAYAYSLKPELLFSIARQESGFKADATSWAGAKGLLQLMPKTASKYARESRTESELVRQLELPSFNIEIASKYLRHLQAYYQGNNYAVIAAYNAGEYVVDLWMKKRNFGDNLTWIENIPFSETKNYVKKVTRNLLVYRALESTE